MKLSEPEVGMFLGGLLAVLVRNRAHEVGAELSEEQWAEARAELIAHAFEDTVKVFPEPLRSRLRENADSFVAAALGLN